MQKVDYLIIQSTDTSEAKDFGKEIIPLAIEQKYKVASYAYGGYWEDIGTIDSFFEANLGLTPMNNGESIMINVPPLTEERRKEMAKKVRAEGENAKISIRNARSDDMKAVKAEVSLPNKAIFSPFPTVRLIPSNNRLSP